MPSRLRSLEADITTLNVDIIVNAANEPLDDGHGVNNAIQVAAGPELLEACKRVVEVSPGVRCPTGEARITPAFRLPCKHVIHTVGPIWKGGFNQEADLLISCYRESLKLAAQFGTSVAFPSISAGAYGYPTDKACEIAVRECKAFLKTDTTLDDVILVSYQSPIIFNILTNMIQYL
jgi:O-acetyl-ADP-ribose deacetylase (regulator of RNase III)